jgi:hypothetical protein
MGVSQDQLQAPREADTDLLVGFLADRDAACPGCGYNLRNLQGDRCPECGDHLVLKVNVAEPRIAPMVAGLLGLAAGAGFNALLLLYVLFHLIAEHWHVDGEDRTFLYVNLIPLLVLAPAIALWLRNWHRIRRASRRARGLLIIAAWTLSLVDLAVFSLMIQ